MSDPAFNDIPGTTLFDSRQARAGYHLNMFCMSLMDPENRRAFKSNESTYLDAWAMTSAQRQAVLKRDWNEMLLLGGNIFFTAKIAATDGLSFLHIAAKMSGVSQSDYTAMMRAGGRPIEGARSKKEWRGG